MSLLPFCEWLASTEWSIALHESLHVYPMVQTIHVLVLLPFIGMVIFVDLRLVGWAFRDVPIAEINARFLPWAIGAFCISVITGALLFFAIPVRTYLSIFFRIKLLMLLIAGLNVIFLHRDTRRNKDLWGANGVLPLRVRVAGGLSLLSWGIVIIMGRMIAYNWFDCNRQPQPDFINWMGGCTAILP